MWFSKSDRPVSSAIRTARDLARLALSTPVAFAQSLTACLAGAFHQLREIVGAEKVLKFGDGRGLVLDAIRFGQRSANNFTQWDARGVSLRRGPAEKAREATPRGNAVGIG
jgi:hypothetical protein